MKIRKIKQADYDEVLKLNEASVPHVNSIDRDDLAWFHEHAAFLVVAEIDDKLAGFMIGLRPGTDYRSENYRWFCANYSDFAYVDRIAVASWARRRGIAESFYTAFAASQPDVPVMTCEVNLRPANEGSMRFHERMGFRQVASQETEGGKKEVALMERTL